MTNDLLYRIALTLVPGIGPVNTKELVQYFHSAEAVFNAKISQLERIPGMGKIRAAAIKNFRQFKQAEQEIRFIEKYRIQPLFITDNNYPQRLLHCYDAPSLLYYRGNANLNASKVVSIVGTRSHSHYGTAITESLIQELAPLQVLVVSGLAYGIDALAHKQALRMQLPTVGVLAHGLDTLFPSAHTALAKEMVTQGGLLTEFTSGTVPEKTFFPRRNRIVAGMADVTVIIESGIRGGSMITAEMAYGYNKDVCAFPGKASDTKSAGCNHLIKTNKAVLITNAADLVQYMNWEEKKKGTARQQKELFTDLSPDEQQIITLLKERETLHIDEIFVQSHLSSSSVAAALLRLEMEQLITTLPGKLYALQ